MKYKCIRTWITGEVRDSDGGKKLLSRLSIPNARERTTISQPAAIVFRQNNSNCVVHQVGLIVNSLDTLACRNPTRAGT
ncbi:MAG: hypothetical protein K6U00_08875, partial [Armatimonadetes bacterium]|nr:hypothetical protein [Armatimonadota bacterium]